MVGWSDNSDKEDERDIPVAGTYKNSWQSKVARSFVSSSITKFQSNRGWENNDDGERENRSRRENWKENNYSRREKPSAPPDVDFERGRPREKLESSSFQFPFCGLGWWIVGAFISIFGLFILATWAFAS